MLKPGMLFLTMMRALLILFSFQLQAAEVCPFCAPQILNVAGFRLAGFQPPANTANFFSSMILDQSPHFLLKVTRGAFVPFYFLIISKEHYTRVADLPPEVMQDLEAFTSHVEDFYREALGGPHVIFEHGSKACAVAGGGSCIDHLHLHILPFAGEIENSPDLRLRTRFNEPRTLARLSELKTDLPYIYYQNPRGAKKLYEAIDHVPSQLMRLLIAEEIGAGEEFNWREFENNGDFFVNAAHSVAGYSQWRSFGAIAARQKIQGKGWNIRQTGDVKLLCSDALKGVGAQPDLGADADLQR